MTIGTQTNKENAQKIGIEDIRNKLFLMSNDMREKIRNGHKREKDNGELRN